MYFQSWRSCHLFACVGTLLTLDYSFDETSPKFTFFIHFSEHLQCFCNLGGSQPSQVLRPTSYGKKSGGEPGWQSALPVYSRSTLLWIRMSCQLSVEVTEALTIFPQILLTLNPTLPPPPPPAPFWHLNSILLYCSLGTTTVAWSYDIGISRAFEI